MSRPRTSSDTLRHRILDATVPLFNASGLKFTMDDLAASLGMSKKTIYALFPSKQILLEAMADYCFDFIHMSKDQVINDPSLPLEVKLRRVLTMLTEKYEGIDLSKLHNLRDRYPTVYIRVAERLETGWEGTMALLEQGVAEGVLRPFPLPIFKLMMESTLEQFFQSDVLVRNGITYRDALHQVVDILLDGVLVRGEDTI